MQYQRLVLFFCCLFMGFVGFSGSAMAEPLQVVTGQDRFPFEVEVVDTPESRAQGLMFRKTLADDAGMLFLLERPQTLIMWMKNTYIPLDMIFFGKGGRVTKIHQNAKPHSTALISSGGVVLGVLEVKAGTAQRLSLKPGDRLVSQRIKDSQ